MVCIGECEDDKVTLDGGISMQLAAINDELEESQWGNVVIAYQPPAKKGKNDFITP